MDRLVGCEAMVEDFLDRHPLANTDAKPRVVTIKESPFTASLLSEEAMNKIRYLETEIQEDIGKRGIANLHIPEELLKAALVLSHASSVAIHFGFPCNSNGEFPDETDGPVGAIVLGKSLKALGKEVTFIACYYHVKLLQELVRTFLENNVSVVEFTPERTHGSGGVRTAANKLLFHDVVHQMSPKFDVLVAIEAVSRSEEGGYMTMKARDLSDICKVSPVDEVFIQGTMLILGVVVTVTLTMWWVLDCGPEVYDPGHKNMISQKPHARAQHHAVATTDSFITLRRDRAKALRTRLI